MSTGRSIIIALAITAIGVIGAFALGAMKLADAPDLRGESSTRARALAIAPELAAQAQEALGEGWTVRAELVGLRPFKSELGARGWEADYEFDVSSSEFPDFRQTDVVTRAFGVGAGRIDQGPLPLPRVFGTILALPEQRRRAFVRGVSISMPDTSLQAVVGLLQGTEGEGERLERTRSDFSRLAKDGRLSAEDAFIVVAQERPRTSVWGFDGTVYRPLGELDENTGAIEPWPER